MNLSRRSFIIGTASAVILPALVALTPPFVLHHGSPEGDPTDALLAIFRGDRNVVWPDGSPVFNEFGKAVLSRRDFYPRRGLVWDRDAMEDAKVCIDLVSCLFDFSQARPFGPTDVSLRVLPSRHDKPFPLDWYINGRGFSGA